MRFINTLLALLLLAFSLSSCVIFGTRNMPAKPGTFGKLENERTWTIQRGTDSARYIRFEDIGAEGIKATVGDIQRKLDHPLTNQKKYWRFGGKYSMRLAHIVVGDGVAIDRTAQFSYADVKSVTVHHTSGFTLLVSAAAITFWTLFYAFVSVQSQ